MMKSNTAHHMAGEILSAEEMKKRYPEKDADVATPLTADEFAAIEPLNRHDRRKALVEMRRERRKLRKQAAKA